MKEHCRYAVKDFRPLIVGEDDDHNNHNNNSDHIARGENHVECLRMMDRSSDDSGESKSKVLDMEDNKEGLGIGLGPHSKGLGLELELGTGAGAGLCTKVAPPSPPRHSSSTNHGGPHGVPLVMSGGGGGGGGGGGLVGLLTQRIAVVSRENSFGFFDPLTRACFQGHLRWGLLRLDYLNLLSYYPIFHFQYTLFLLIYSVVTFLLFLHKIALPP